MDIEGCHRFLIEQSVAYRCVLGIKLYQCKFVYRRLMVSGFSVDHDPDTLFAAKSADLEQSSLIMSMPWFFFVAPEERVRVDVWEALNSPNTLTATGPAPVIFTAM